MTQDKSPDETQSLLPDSNPAEIARRHVQNMTAGGLALPKRIGQYSIKRAIASGGMGTVYEAVQEKPRRTVALKLMRAGIASRSALRRFEFESQLLSRLRHPGIAQVYEAGTHRDGEVTVPYFAMEYIVGAKPITDYAKEKKLGTRDRLKLFAEVCGAVHHGHQKGIIHRDLKPSNILVDSSGQVKVIDFGVARCTDSDMAVTTLQTDVGQLIGTLQYMSPEQCAADPHDIDTRSDVYALGVILYEMLCERVPYDVKGTALHEATRVVREQEPARLTTSNKSLGGEVETITFKALEKDRDRRYQSAVEFAQDIRRYLAGEGITARPPSIIYQLRVFARRNKGVFASLAAVFIILLTGIIVSTSLYVRAEHARAEQSRERQRAELETQNARREREKSEKFAEFMTQTLEGVGPSVALGRDTTMLREVVDAAAKRIAAGELSSTPDAELRLRMTIGRVYGDIAEYQAAEMILSPAVPLAENVLLANQRAHPGDHPTVARSLTDLSDCLQWAGRRTEALPKYEETLAVRRRLYPADHADVAQSLSDVGYCLVSLRRRPEALPYFKEALAMRKRLFSGDHGDVVESLLHLGKCLDWLGRFSEAMPLWQEALAIEQRLHPGDHPSVVSALNMVAYGLGSLGRLDEELPMVEFALAMQRRLVPADNHGVAVLLHNLALNLDWLGRWTEALPRYQEALAMNQRLSPGDNGSAWLFQLNMAYTLGSLGRSAEALSIFEEALAMCRRVLPADDWRIHFAEIGLASGTYGMGHYAEAERIMLPAWEAMAGKGIAKPYERRCLMTLIQFYESWDAAEPGRGYAEKAAEWRAEIGVQSSK